MLVPLLLWAATGLVFLTKTGYGDAYTQLEPKLYPIERQIRLPEDTRWSQVKVMRTILGYHLIVLQDGRWVHLDPFTFSEQPNPNAEELNILISDAMSTNKARFGVITETGKNGVITDTDVQITLDWATLALQQSGRDTRFINLLYQIHYLQWLGSPKLDKVLGAMGIVGLLLLTVYGFALYAKRVLSNRN